jgi:hypothetical protein
MPSEHALNASALEVTAVYTLHVFLALQTLYRIYKSPRRTYRLPHTLFVLLLLILGTLPTAAYLALFLNYTEAVISAPAPSLTPYDAHLGVVNPRILMLPSVAIVNMGNIPPLLVVLFTQSYMAYRTAVIWNRKILVTALFIPFSFVVVVLGALGVFSRTPSVFSQPQPQPIQLPMPTPPPPQARAASGVPCQPKTFFIAFWALSVAFEVCITLAIVLRLLWMRYRLKQAILHSTSGAGANAVSYTGSRSGSEVKKLEEFMKDYTSIIAILVESALLYTLLDAFAYPSLLNSGTLNVIVDSVPGAAGNQAQKQIVIGLLFSPLMVQTQCIASEMIIFRFALGRGWDEEVSKRLSQSTMELDRRTVDVEKRLPAVPS